VKLDLVQMIERWADISTGELPRRLRRVKDEAMNQVGGRDLGV
jgi:hypothetical protein